MLEENRTEYHTKKMMVSVRRASLRHLGPKWPYAYIFGRGAIEAVMVVAGVPKEKIHLPQLSNDCCDFLLLILA